MAEEEIVILASSDDEDTSLRDIEEEKDTRPPLDKKKKILFAGIGIVTFLLLIILIVTISMNSSNEAKISNIDTEAIVEKLNKKNDISIFSPSRLENMIKKANLLYERGDKMEALKVYERIATFNEAISYYNLGVAKIKDKNYQEALESFKKAIDNGEQRCVSAINAAVSALELGNHDLFEYYIDLAYTYLPGETNAPLYSYYVGLINYYRDYYYESLAALSSPDSPYYQYEKNYLSSKILSSININDKSVNKLEKISTLDDALTIGLLYARLGEYNIAENYLIKAIQNTNNPLNVKSALMLVENKLGKLASSSSLMLDLLKSEKTDIYPIKTIIKDSLFDVNIAQEEFDKTLFFDNTRTYGLLFYFAPFKVFNAKQTIDYIRKGSINIYMDQIGPALSYLKKSSTISKVNISISQGIKEALSYHTQVANQIFLEMIDAYPKHSILHYNLALTYAQMSDFTNAYKHFSTSYHLDNSNYIAGAFAIMCGQLLEIDIKKLSEDIKASIEEDTSLEKDNLSISLIQLTENNQLALTRWLEQKKENTPLNLVFDAIIAQKTYNEKVYRQKANILQSILPRDIMANIINFNVKYKKGDIKEYAKAIQIEFKKLNLDYGAFYYGPRLVQEQYIKLLQVGGLLYHERDKLIKKVELETNDVPAIMQTLAYLSIYTHNFEEAYTLYNKLIDDYKKNDTKTVFLAAVASIGANHSENAVALLELSKLIDPTNKESRYGLGLLYQEINNFNAASIQYAKIGDSDFKSEYFSFKITK